MVTPKAVWPQWAAADYRIIKESLETIRVCTSYIIDRSIKGRQNLSLAEKLLPLIEAQASQVSIACYRVNAERSGRERWPRWSIRFLDEGPAIANLIKVYVGHAQAGLGKQNISLLEAMASKIIGEVAILAELFFAGPGPAVEVEDIDAEIEKIIAESGI